MGNLVEQCLAHTKREYPSGYGFALTYLDDSLNPAHIRDAARDIVERVFARGRLPDTEEGLTPKSMDVARFVMAYARAECPEDWLIEGAQLVHSAALAGHPNAEYCMAYCGHPGYEKEQGA